MKTVLFLVWKSFGNEFIIEELEKGALRSIF